eukprot:c32033_g1_i1 orf=1-177(-)
MRFLPHLSISLSLLTLENELLLLSSLSLYLPLSFLWKMSFFYIKMPYSRRIIVQHRTRI